MEWALVLASVVVGIATAVLAGVTWALWQETRAARIPRIVAALDWIGPDYAELRIVNAGLGAALNVDIEFGVEGDERRFQEPVVMPSEGYNFQVLSASSEEEDPKLKKLGGIAAAYSTISANGTYEDVRDNDYELHNTLNIASSWDDVKASRRLVAFRGPLMPFYNLLSDIRDSVRSLSK